MISPKKCAAVFTIWDWAHPHLLSSFAALACERMWKPARHQARGERRDNYKWVRCAVQCAVSLHIGAMWSGQHAPCVHCAVCILQFVFIIKCIAQFFTRTVHSTVVQLSDPHSGGRQLVNTTITELAGRLRDAAAANFNFKEQYNWISTFYQIRDMQRTWWAIEVKQIVGEGTFEKKKTDKGLNHRN